MTDIALLIEQFTPQGCRQPLRCAATPNQHPGVQQPAVQARSAPSRPPGPEPRRRPGADRFEEPLIDDIESKDSEVVPSFPYCDQAASDGEGWWSAAEHAPCLSIANEAKLLTHLSPAWPRARPVRSWARGSAASRAGHRCVAAGCRVLACLWLRGTGRGGGRPRLSQKAAAGAPRADRRP